MLNVQGYKCAAELREVWPSELTSSGDDIDREAVVWAGWEEGALGRLLTEFPLAAPEVKAEIVGEWESIVARYQHKKVETQCDLMALWPGSR